MDVINNHELTPEVRRKAEAAGIDLDALKRSDPTTYAMLSAQRIVRVSPQLKEVAGRALFTAFPQHQIFDLPRDGALLELRIFPPLTPEEVARLDDALAALAAQAPLVAAHAFYRVVSDTAGEHRELALPVSPDNWQGQAGVMVGPFASQVAAKAWSDAHVDTASGLVSDVLPYASSRGEAWFCDLFRGDTP